MYVTCSAGVAEFSSNESSDVTVTRAIEGRKTQSLPAGIDSADHLCSCWTNRRANGNGRVPEAGRLESMNHTTPNNSASQSDERFWYLRELQDLLKMPASRKGHSAFEKRPVVDLTTGAAVVIGEVAVSSGSDCVFILAGDGRALHVLDDQGLRQTLKVVIEDDRACHICASDDAVYIACQSGRLFQLKIFSLLEEVGGGASTAVGLEKLPYKVATIHVLRSAAAPGPRMIALASSSHPRLILYGATPAELWELTWPSQDVRHLKVDVHRSQAFSAGVTISDICVSERSGHIYIADSRGGRILRLDPNDYANSLRVIAGDGVRNDSEHMRYGASQLTRLGELTGICEFRIHKQFAELLSGVVTPNAPSEWENRGWVARSSSAKSKRMKAASAQAIQIRRERIAEVIEEKGAFLVAVDRMHRAALTISFPDDNPVGRDSAGSSSRHTWPLLPVRRVGDEEQGDKPGGRRPPPVHIDSSKVCVGPAASLLFWSAGEAELGIYAPITSILEGAERNKAADEELMRLSAEQLWTET
jgi:hypothetical protein